jgi:glycerol-3-phosphate cytidylyltransferase|tara:strand:+ start:1883 stop:2314 length:432 start_codon:yes stop_codon:yes gene_type:complete
MKIGITFSAFDLFHAGHVIMLKEARKYCDHLIVGLQTDPSVDRPNTKNAPVQTVFERFVQISACKYVDEIIPYTTEKEVLDILLSYPIDVRIMGEEYRDKEFSGKDICKEKGIEIVYNNRKHTFSTTQLRTRIFDAQSDNISQ